MSTVSMDTLRFWTRRYRAHAECVAVALLALIAALALGVAARRRLAPLRAQVARLEADHTEMSNFRALFRAAAPGADEARRLSQAFADSLGIAVRRELRVSLAEEIVGRAERLGLSDVRVRFSTPHADSAAPPKAPDLASTQITVADYTISLDCAGGFAAVLSLLAQLPPSVAFERMTASRTAGGALYHLSFAVFESTTPVGGASPLNRGIAGAGAGGQHG